MNTTRLTFAARYALRHLGISVLVALISAVFVFGFLYPEPFRSMQKVGSIYLLILAVDVVCGPILTLVVASPRKSVRERWLDFGLVGLIQVLALAYGLHSVWISRPTVLAFEVDRLVMVTASEIEEESLAKAPDGMRRLPVFGVMKVGVRRAKSSDEMFDALGRDMAGLSPAMRPNWWVPWSQQQAEIRAQAKPLRELIAQKPEDAQKLRDAASAAKVDPASLMYLPLTSSKTKDWVALLDVNLNLVGYAPVDGF